MSTARRFSYSLLISTLVFTAFTVAAFSGIFPWIEAQFYSPKVVADTEARLDEAEQGLRDWQSATVEKVGKLLTDGGFAGVFSSNPSREALLARYRSAKLTLLGIQGGGSLRILDSSRTAIHFSTEDADVKKLAEDRLTYRPLAEAADLPDLKAPGLSDGKPHLISDDRGQRLWFLVPWTDTQGATSGYALLAASLDDARQFLLARSIALADQGLVALPQGQYLFSLQGRATDPAVLSRVRELVGMGKLPSLQRLGAVESGPQVVLVHRGLSLVLLPAASLELSPGLKVALLLSLFTVVFLVVFLLANLRGEPVSVVTRKVKRFQLQVVKQYLDLKEQDRIQSLRDELAKHSDEIRADVRRSLGRVRRKDEEWVDRYIDTSWQEVMDLLRGPAPPSEPSSNADWKRLETLLQQALTQGRFVVSGQPARGGGASPAAADVEELVEDVEDLDEDVEDLGDDIEDLGDDVEDLGDDVEDLGDEVEDLGDEVEDLADEVEDLADEVEDLGDDAEVAATREPSPGPRALESRPAGKPDAGDDADDVDDLEVLDEVEELDDAEEVDDAEDADPIAEELDELEELEEVDLTETETRSEPEELVPLDPSSTLFHARGPTAPEEALTMLPISPDETDEDLESLEELEEVEEAEAVPVGEDVSYPLDRLDAVWGAQAGGVFDESDDVVRLKDDLFQDVPEANDPFGQLVGEVLAGGEGGGFVPLDKEDLLPQVISRDWRWTGAGFDWDRFAQGTDEVSLFRALSEIVTELDGFTAAILVNDEGLWTAQSSVGFSDSGKEVLAFGPDKPLTRQFLDVRALHLLKGGGTHPVLRDSFHPKDLKFLRAVLCVPLLFRHEPAWLLLGLRNEPSDPLGMLAPRRVG